MDKFPFLCVKDDEIHWNATINVKSKKKKSGKSTKTKTVNMIDIYYKRLHDYQKYPNQIINDKLYLGMLEQAAKPNILSNLKITHLLNVTPTEYPDMSIINDRKYYQIKIADIKETCIADYFEDAFKFIDNAMNCDKSRILIHCKEGVSRSATIVIAYLMQRNKKKLDETLKSVKNKREVVDPNDGFMQQLCDFEQNNYIVKDKQY